MGDHRLIDIIQKGTSGDVVLLGFPHDSGVTINGGRPGAAKGPEAFRFWLERYGTVQNPECGIDLDSLSIADAGDVPKDLAHEDAHLALSEKVREILDSGSVPFVVGGGNDQSYPNASALLESQLGDALGVVNVDAHLDVRPLRNGQAHSGSSFRQLLEDTRFDPTRFIEFACQGSQCSQTHADYVLSKGSQIYWLGVMQERGNLIASFRTTFDELASKCENLFVSFDLDSVAGAEAPGVSCPSVIGLTTIEAISIARIAGQHPKVRCFDLSEYNPKIENEQTGRLTVALFYNFCLGIASRKDLK